MKYRRFGKTELRMPVISFGCMRFQTAWDRSATITRESQKNLERIVEHALELGITHFETARGYGTSEAQLGRVLPHLNRKDILLQTKVGPRPTGAEFTQQVRDSLKTLNVEYVDLLAVHGLNNHAVLDDAFKKNGTIEALLRLKEQGLVRHIGFSCHAGPDIVTRAVQTGVFDYMNVWYSYVYQDNWPAIQEARRRDMGVFIISPNDKGGKLHEPPAKLVRLSRPLSPMQVNDLFILAHRQIHTISCGAARPSDFDDHATAVVQWDSLMPKARAVVKRFDREQIRVLGARWVRRYREGLPAWDKTPGNINIPVILWLWNLARVFDLTEYAKMRYNLLGSGGHWFPGERAEKLADVDPNALRKALRRSPFSEQIIDVLCEAHATLTGQDAKRLGGDH